MTAATLPVLRPPTLMERVVFAVTQRWPLSYVEARLEHSDAIADALDRLPLEDRLRVIFEENPYLLVPRDV